MTNADLRLALCADASPERGVGHVLRALSLAEAALDRGLSVRVLSHQLPASLRARFTGQGLAPEDPGEGTAALAQDLGEATGPNSWVLLDGYGFDAAWHRALRALGWRVAQLDDHVHLPRYDVDLLINPNLGFGPEHYLGRAEGARLLLGPSFTPLRRVFRQAAARPPRAPGPFRVLATFGGSDPTACSEWFLDLAPQAPAAWELCLAVGPVNPRQQALLARAGRCEVVLDPDLPALMAQADLVLSAAGSTCWELAALGVPMALVTVADNQRAIALHLGEAGAALDLGWAKEVDASRLLRALGRLAEGPDTRTSMGLRARALVDGQGAGRILDAMEAP